MLEDPSLDRRNRSSGIQLIAGSGTSPRKLNEKQREGWQRGDLGPKTRPTAPSAGRCTVAPRAASLKNSLSGKPSAQSPSSTERMAATRAWSSSLSRRELVISICTPAPRWPRLHMFLGSTAGYR